MGEDKGHIDYDFENHEKGLKDFEKVGLIAFLGRKIIAVVVALVIWFFAAIFIAGFFPPAILAFVLIFILAGIFVVFAVATGMKFKIKAKNTEYIRLRVRKDGFARIEVNGKKSFLHAGVIRVARVGNTAKVSIWGSKEKSDIIFMRYGWTEVEFRSKGSITTSGKEANRLLELVRSSKNYSEKYWASISGFGPVEKIKTAFAYPKIEIVESA